MLFIVNKEYFTIPSSVLNSITENDGIELIESTNPAAPDTSQEKVESVIRNSVVPNTGVALGKESVEKREQSFEIEDAKCKSIKFCENLRTNMNCGYCLQDDIAGNHPFHYGDEDGPFLKRSGGKQSLCKRNEKSEWIPPSSLNGDKLNQLEEQEEYYKRRYTNENDPRRITALSQIQDEKNDLAIKDTGMSGCLKMRERYICSKVNDCSPMNFEMFGIKAKDICGFCADDGKAYARTDLVPNAKTMTKTQYVSEPKCENIEIFGDGVPCSSYTTSKDLCVNAKSLKDPSIQACAYNYNMKQVKIPIPIPFPSDVKYGQTDSRPGNDKCNSEWGLIRPDKCDWFENAYPCLKTKGGGPHSEKCLESLWKQMGFITSYRELYNHGEGELVNNWNTMDVNRVMESMQEIYDKIYSSEYDVAKKWAKICFNMNVNDCNRAGLINDKNSDQYWKINSDACMQKLYKYGGGKEGGLANPKNQEKWSYGSFGSLKEGLSNPMELVIRKMTRPNDFRENETEHEIHSQSQRYGNVLKFDKLKTHRDYIESIRDLVKMKNMSDEEAKKVPQIYSSANWAKKIFKCKLGG